MLYMLYSLCVQMQMCADAALYLHLCIVFYICLSETLAPLYDWCMTAHNIYFAFTSLPSRRPLH